MSKLTLDTNLYRIRAGNEGMLNIHMPANACNDHTISRSPFLPEAPMRPQF